MGFSDMFSTAHAEEDREINNPAVGRVLGHLGANAELSEFRLFVALGTFRTAEKRAVTPAGVLYVQQPTT